jgi:hypothetical protein
MHHRTASKSACTFLLTILTAWLSSCGSGEFPRETPEGQEQALHVRNASVGWLALSVSTVSK